MKKIISAAALSLSLMAMASPSYATLNFFGGDKSPKMKDVIQQIEQNKKDKKEKIANLIEKKKEHFEKKREHCNTVPEMDAAGAGLALALAGGLVSIARERRRKQK